MRCYDVCGWGSSIKLSTFAIDQSHTSFQRTGSSLIYLTQQNRSATKGEHVDTAVAQDTADDVTYLPYTGEQKCH